MNNNKWLPYLLVLPSVLIFLMFSIFPVFYMFYLSVHEGSIVRPAIAFNGLDNYIELFNDPSFSEAVWNTLEYSILSVLLLVLLAVPLSLLLSKKGKIYRFATSIIFSPHVIALVSVALIFTWIMDTDNGILNWFVTALGFDPIGWLTDVDMALYSLVLVGVWKGIGYYTLIMMSAISGLPSDVYEAAALDNTPKWRLFTKITLPLLSPTIFFIVIVSLINNIQVFDTINVMTGGGPVNSTTTLVYYLYEQMFRFSDIGGSAATGMLLLLLLIVLNVVYFRLFSKKVYYK